jgi:hypothetical protein
VSLRRAARFDGWYGLADTPEEAARILGEIQRHREKAGYADAPSSSPSCSSGRPVRPRSRRTKRSGSTNWW